MTANNALIGPHLQQFFTAHLCQHRRASTETIDSYRYTFRLLLLFMHDKIGIEPAKLRIVDLDASMVLAFLDHLERDRANSVRTRNIRLSAIRSFFRLVALRDPDSLAIATQVLAIPVKREDKKLVGYLSREEIDALIAAPDRSKWSGRRDHALLLTMYNSGARVSEMTTLKQNQVCFGPKTYLQLMGKGRKERTVPLWPHTAKTLKAWFSELGTMPDTVAFPNARGKPLSRYGVNYLLNQTAAKAATVCPSLSTKKVAPHRIRHTTAMALLQAGVDIAVIALWLGHESIETTHVYLQTDLKTKERALEKLEPVGGTLTRFKADDPLLRFLASL